MPSKRCLKIVETKESKALKAMREFRGRSVRRLADELGMSHAAVHQLECGRADLTQSYLNKFLNCLGFSTSDWHLFTKDDEGIEDLRCKCIEVLHAIQPTKLRQIYKFISEI